MLPEEHVYKKWANFPASRQRLLDLLTKTKPNRTLLLSGDRHITEVSKVSVPGLNYDLFDITSSGLTHASQPRVESNKHRVGELVAKVNYGLITINWAEKPLTVTVNINGDNQATYLTQAITFQGLREWTAFANGTPMRFPVNWDQRYIIGSSMIINEPVMSSPN